MYKGLGIKLNNIRGDLWCEFEDTIKFMKIGQFNACSKAISLIREKMTTKPNNYNVSFDWMLQINSYVCQKFHPFISGCQTNSEGSHVNAEVLLQNIQGIVPTMVTLEMELMLIYNSSFDVIGNSRNCTVSVSRLFSFIERSLFRLYSFLQVQESDILIQQNSLLPVLKAILLRKEAFTGSMLTVFSLICCVICWLLLIRTQTWEALAVIKLFHDSSSCFLDNVETMEDDIIEPVVCSSLPGLRTRDFFQLTNAFCLIFCGQTSEALLCLRKISEEEWHSRIQYILASVLLSSDQMDEPFTLTKSLLSSGMPSLPSLWRSRVFNLIGCCLVHKKKPYSAVECFRKSLNYNPDQVLPLLNITCVYRSLGFMEAELKGLRILLQEIQDREIRENTATVKVLQDPLPLVEELTIAKADVLYVLAKRLQETGSFPQSFATYEQLLEHLKTTLRHESVLLPSAPELYKDAICAAYLASLHAQCLELCKRAEEDCPEAFGDANESLMSSLDSGDLGPNKRLELDPLFEGPCARRRTRSADPRVFGFTISLLKALSCHSLGRHREALDLLQGMKRALSCAKVCGERFPVKRARLEGDSSGSQEEERNGWKVLSSSVYSCLGALQLQSQTPAEDVAYLLHSAILSWPDNVEAYFHYAKLLLREGREDGAKKTWALVRSKLPIQPESNCPTSFLTITREELGHLDRRLTPELPPK